MKQTTGFKITGKPEASSIMRALSGARCTSQIFHHQVKIYRWVFNSLPANGDYCCLLINFANGLVPDQA